MRTKTTLKNTLGLRYEPTQFNNRSNAFGWSSRTTKPSMVILGDNQKFWVVCPADASRLVRLGYEYAQ